MKSKLMVFRNGLVVLCFLLLAINSKAQNANHKEINITNFQVIKEKGKVAIRWETDNALPTNYFEVERSADGKSFKTVAYVLGADPAQNNCECFGCFDKIDAAAKESYYRLKHVDINGSVQLSTIKMLALK